MYHPGVNIYICSSQEFWYATIPACMAKSILQKLKTATV